MPKLKERGLLNMETKIYALYGLLGREKRTVYSTARGDHNIYDILTVEIPDFIETYENQIGDLVLEIPGCKSPYLLREILGGNESPYLLFSDQNGTEQKIELKVLEIEEH